MDSAIDRKRWGCDAEATAFEVVRTTCPSCMGRTRDQSTPFDPAQPWVACEECGGDGDVSYRRCPTALLDPESHEVVAAWADLRAGRGWPQAGARGDQAATFIKAVALLDSELALIREDQRKREEERAKSKR